MENRNPLYVHKEYPLYRGNEDVYNLDEIRQRIYWAKDKRVFELDFVICKILNSFSKPIKQNGTTYYLKDDIDKCVNMFEDTIEVNELFSEDSYYSSIRGFRLALKKNGIEVFTYGGTIPFYSKPYILKKDKQKALEIAKSGNKKEYDDYYTLKEAASILGLSYKSRFERITKMCKYKKVGKYIFILKKDVDFVKNIKDSTVSIVDVYKETGLTLQGLQSVIKREGFDYFDYRDWPFPGHASRVYQEDVDYVKKKIATQKEFSAANKHRRYEILKEISKVKINPKIKSTLKDLDEFMVEKLNSYNGTDVVRNYINAGSRIYNFMNLTLNMDLKNFRTYECDTEKTNNDSIENIMSIFMMNDEHSILDFYIFVTFYNFLIDKYALNKPYQKINISLSGLYNGGTINVKPYTHNQFIDLFDALFNSIYDESFFKRIINDKVSATTWLYMALHFCVGWRRTDIINIEHPDLNVIGFSNGKEFLDFLTEPTKFTEEMGFAICSNVKTLVEGLGRTTDKTGEDLVIEIGRTLVKPIGMMLAVCEAYRMIGDNKKLMSKGNVVKKRNQLKVLGYRYSEILGEEVFSNRRANKAYMNYLVSKSDGDNNGIGYFIAALVRSHKLNENLIPISTQKYVNREVDRDISSAVMELWDTGGFAFVNYELLSLINEDFDSLKLAEKRAEIRKVKLSPLGINEISKELEKRHSVSRDITKGILKNLSKNKEIFKETIVNLTKAKSVGKHKNIKCLLKAMPLKAILELNKEGHSGSEEITGVSNEECLYPDVAHCEGCPMLIIQIYYIFELKNKINKLLNKLDTTDDEFDIMLLSKIFAEGYTSILSVIIDEIGSDAVNSMIGLGEIQNRVLELQEKNKLRLG